MLQGDSFVYQLHTEQNQILRIGLHETIFPMFEFEMHGGVEELEKMEIELCEHLGIPLDIERIKTYDDWASTYQVEELDHVHEDDR